MGQGGMIQHDVTMNKSYLVVHYPDRDQFIGLHCSTVHSAAENAAGQHLGTLHGCHQLSSHQRRIGACRIQGIDAVGVAYYLAEYAPGVQQLGKGRTRHLPQLKCAQACVLVCGLWLCGLKQR